ncbi:MAG: hypothetical protein ABSE15_05015 [Candidatus Bathyarchaeia archaeon]
MSKVRMTPEQRRDYYMGYVHEGENAHAIGKHEVTCVEKSGAQK